MKKAVLVLVLLTFTLSNLFSQNAENTLDSYLSNFQYKKALEYIDTEPPTKTLLHKKALCYKALGNYKQAAGILEALSEEFPEDVKINTDLAGCFEAMGSMEKSIECYDRLIQSDTTNSYFRMQKAELLYQSKKYDQALGMYKDIYAENGYLNMLKRSAQCYEKMNQPDSAKWYFSVLCGIDSTDIHAAASLINLHLKTSHYLDAIMLSDHYVQKDSTNKQINLLNALAYYAADLYEEAVKRFTKCYNEGDTTLIVNRSLGISHYSLKNVEESYKHLGLAFQQDTTNNNVLYCLAVTCNDIGKPKESIDYFLKLMDRVIPSPMVVYLYYKNLAQAYHTDSQYKKSYEAFTEALKNADEDQKMNIYYVMANMLEYDMKDRNNALKYYQLYKQSLTAYIEKLKKEEEPDEVEIRICRGKLTKLTEFLDKLKTSAPNV